MENLVDFYSEFVTKGICGATKEIGDAFASATKKPEAMGVSFALGLTGETGEVVDILKKYFINGRPMNVEHLTEELGDVLWYLLNIGSLFSIDLNQIMEYNINKLKERYKDVYEK